MPPPDDSNSGVVEKSKFAMLHRLLAVLPSGTACGVQTPLLPLTEARPALRKNSLSGDEVLYARTSKKTSPVIRKLGLTRLSWTLAAVKSVVAMVTLVMVKPIEAWSEVR